MSKFKIGDKVKLSPKSGYYGRAGQIPTDGHGEITEDSAGGGLRFIVQWPTGSNSYSDEDLVLYRNPFKGNK